MKIGQDDVKKNIKLFPSLMNGISDIVQCGEKNPVPFNNVFIAYSPKMPETFRINGTEYVTKT